MWIKIPNLQKWHVKAFNDLLGAKGDSIARYAVEIARNSGRKTIKDTDVILASQR